MCAYHKYFLWQGVGGIIELAPGYLPAAYGSVRKAGGLCISDEVQAGFGRTGNHFWGFETQGVVPDIVTMAKVSPLLYLVQAFHCEASVLQ
jgi:4-aminobutyrate aminotransferase-like enzyme